MSGLGRFHCLLIATKGGDVIYERFYDRLSEYEKADVRAAFQLASSSVRLGSDGEQDHIGTYKSAHFAFIPYADLVFYLLGSGEYDELSCAGVLRSIAFILHDILRSKVTAGLLLEKYTKLCMVVDEVINEGLLETTDRDIIRKALKHKAIWE